MLKVFFGIVVLVAVAYLGDWAIFTFRKDPTGTVMVRPVTEVPRNDKKMELMFDQPREESCVNSMFPHQGMLACWYLRKYPERKTDL